MTHHIERRRDDVGPVPVQEGKPPTAILLRAYLDAALHQPTSLGMNNDDGRQKQLTRYRHGLSPPSAALLWLESRTHVLILEGFTGG